MATARIVLTSNPIKITEGVTGVRMQSKSVKFCWSAATVKPTDLSLCHEDSDVYVQDKGPIWAWYVSPKPLTIIVT